MGGGAGGAWPFGIASRRLASTPATQVMRIVLDSGALIALERNDRSVWATLKLAALNSNDVLVPSTALAQVWRGARTQAALSRALQHCITG